VDLLQVPIDMTFESLLEEIQQHSPDVIGISMASRQWLRAAELVPPLREVVDIPVVAGGLHASFASDTVLDTPGFDYVCIGEGEQAMLELIEAIEANNYPPDGIPNIRIKGGDAPPLRAPFEPIDALPFMARDMLGEKYGVRNVVTQRGCPYTCTYCAARQFSDLYEGSYANYGRRRSPENVLREIAELRELGELNYIIFLDDTFTINHAWIKTFCKLYAEQGGPPFSLHARSETVSATLIEHLAEAGCRHIVYGVESGSQRVRRDILQRNISNERLCESFRLTQAAGILATANYMLGIPGETSADIEETLALHDELKPDDFGYFVFYPYPGTSLFKLCTERGYLPDKPFEFPAHHHGSILNLPDLSAQEIEAFYHRFTDLRIRDRLADLPPTTTEHDRQALIDKIRQDAHKG
jgi:anaerobic magnesium-protoporphyrin IX monomethyl ester cyclase